MSFPSAKKYRIREGKFENYQDQVLYGVPDNLVEIVQTFYTISRNEFDTEEDDSWLLEKMVQIIVTG